MNYDEELIANLILSLRTLKGVGSRSIQRILIEQKSKLESVNNYNYEFLKSLNVKMIEKGLDSSTLSWEEIQKKSANVLEIAYNNGIKVLHPYMIDYPQRLLANSNFPVILFCKGNIKLLNDSKIVAIIGTRNPTDFGKKMGYRLSSLLSEDGYVVVSGLAVGSDTIGHLGAVNSSGKTIAVLPTSIDAPVYPKENQKLSKQILDKGGLLISEYAPGTKIHGRDLISNLIARDEWQAGLSDGVIVIETSLKGGSNHAIKHAIDTKTPLAMFDYSTKIKDEFYKNERFEGNVSYIRRNMALAIYHMDTIEEFKEIMKNYRVNLIMRDLLFKRKECISETNDKNEQTSLF